MRAEPQRGVVGIKIYKQSMGYEFCDCLEDLMVYVGEFEVLKRAACEHKTYWNCLFKQSLNE